MSRVRVYLKTYDSTGVLDSDFTEITKHVDINSIGNLRQSIDNTEYDVGIVRNSSISLKVQNNQGFFSTPDILESLFKFKRDDSIIKITWNFRDTPMLAGFFNACDEILFDDITIFEGLLNDDATNDETKKQIVSFKVLGYDTLLSRVNVPFSSINDGDLFSAIFLDLLNQTTITDFVTVSAANINPSLDLVSDAVASLENKTVLAAFKELLLLSNSVFYIDASNVVHIAPRTPTAAVQYTFYGQGSNNGIENINDMSKIKSGVNRIFNSWAWTDTALIQQDISSVTKYGVRQKEISSAVITDTTKRNSVLTELLTEFKNPKKEMTIVSSGRCGDNMQLFMLDRVNIDYPLVPIPEDGNDLPIYDVSKYDDNERYPFSLFNLSIETLDHWKIMERQFDGKKDTMTFNLRAI